MCRAGATGHWTAIGRHPILQLVAQRQQWPVWAAPDLRLCCGGRQQHVHCMCMLCVVARQYPQRYAINLNTTSATLPFPSLLKSLPGPSLLLSLLSPVPPSPSLSLDSPSFFPSPFSPPVIASKGNISLHVQL